MKSIHGLNRRATEWCDGRDEFKDEKELERWTWVREWMLRWNRWNRLFFFWRSIASTSRESDNVEPKRSVMKGTYFEDFSIRKRSIHAITFQITKIIFKCRRNNELIFCTEFDTELMMRTTWYVVQVERNCIHQQKAMCWIDCQNPRPSIAFQCCDVCVYVCDCLIESRAP